MLISNTKILCEVNFRDFRKNEKLKVTGMIDIDILTSSEEKHIGIENYIFERQQWIKHISFISKVDIIQIKAFKAQVCLDYKNGNLVIDPEIFEDQKYIEDVKKTTIIM